MDKLIIPEGCNIEGDALAIRHEGDIVIENEMSPDSLVSGQGSIRFHPKQKEARFRQISAENGMLEIEADTLEGAEVKASSMHLKARDLKLTGPVKVEERLFLEAGRGNLHSCTAENLEIKADDFSVQAELGATELILQTGTAHIGLIKARRIVIRGSLDCKRVEAEESIIVEEGNVAIKYLDAPSFHAAPEVSGIVVIATCKDVKAEGVRGFLHPTELGMLSEAAGGDTFITQKLPDFGDVAEESTSEEPVDEAPAPAAQEPVEEVAPAAVEQAAVEPEPEVAEADPEEPAPAEEPEAEPEPDPEPEPAAVEETEAVSEDAEDEAEEVDTLPGDDEEDAADAAEEHGESAAPDDLNEYAPAPEVDETEEPVAVEEVPEVEEDATSLPHDEDNEPHGDDDGMGLPSIGETNIEEIEVGDDDDFDTGDFPTFEDDVLYDSEDGTASDEAEPVTSVDTEALLDEVQPFAEDMEIGDDILDEDDGYQLDDIEDVSDLVGEGESSSDNDTEEILALELTEKLNQVRAFFPDDNQPNFITQINRYIEERRFTVFAKEANRNAVLSKFDEYEHEEISHLAREFFAIMEQYL